MVGEERAGVCARVLLAVVEGDVPALLQRARERPRVREAIEVVEAWQVDAAGGAATEGLWRGFTRH